MKEYLKTKEDVLAGVKSEQSGISSAEASSRLEKNGKNKLAEGKKDSLIKRFLSQLADPMIIILIIGGDFENLSLKIGICLMFGVSSE